jgi:hypothetical protein
MTRRAGALLARVPFDLWVLLIVSGALLWGLGLFADRIGVGGTGGANWKQVLAAQAGAVAVFAGVLALAFGFWKRDS